MTKNKKSMCKLCRVKKAKFIEKIQNRQGSARDPMFCSVHCAAVFGCISIAEDEYYQDELNDEIENEIE